MGILKKLIGKIKQFGRPHRLSMQDVNAPEREWHIFLTPWGIIAAMLAFVVIVFVGVLLLVAYTPITNLLPSYRSEALRSREEMMQNIMRLDSLERKMNDMVAYNENIAILVRGGSPAVRTATSADSLSHSKNIVPPSAEDSLLRAQMTGNSAYNLDNTVRPAANDKLKMLPPVEGMVIDRFDLRNNIYGIRLATSSMAQVTSTAEGTVMSAVWSPDKGFIVQIQHPDGMVSVYANLQQSIVSPGQVVRPAEVIGYTSDKPSASSDNLFEFQLWLNGKVVDPESLIVF